MIRDISLGQSGQIVEKAELKLPSFHEPSFQEDLESAMQSGKSFQMDGTNVIRVPFGIRQPQKQRPQKPNSWATLVLPLQPLGSPTPPPHAA